MKKLKHIVRDTIFGISRIVSMRLYTSIRYRYAKGKWINWQHPRDINEKIQWLKFYGDTSQWPRLADKYAVRDFVIERGFEDNLIPLIGKWEQAEDISWDNLPKQFVMKANHGSGDVMVCTDRSQIDTRQWTQYFSEILKHKFGRELGEPHYDKITPCIVAEQLLDIHHQSSPSSSMIDYKIWCFDGKPVYIYTCYNRTKEQCNVGLYDTQWNYHPEYIAPNDHYLVGAKTLNKPTCLDEMLQMAGKLSEGLTLVRCDLYETNKHVYFGEMTMTPASGLNYSYTQDFLNILGDLCKIK